MFLDKTNRATELEYFVELRYLKKKIFFLNSNEISFNFQFQNYYYFENSTGEFTQNRQQQQQQRHKLICYGEKNKKKLLNVNEWLLASLDGWLRFRIIYGDDSFKGKKNI